MLTIQIQPFITIAADLEENPVSINPEERAATLKQMEVFLRIEVELPLVMN